MRTKKHLAPKKLEKEIQREIMEFLRYLGIECWVNKTTGFYDTKKKFFRKNNDPYAINGVPDILGWIDTKFLAIEVKSKNGKLSEDQKRFIDKVQATGHHIAFVARSIEDVALELAKHFPQPENDKFRKFMGEYVQSRRTDH